MNRQLKKLIVSGLKPIIYSLIDDHYRFKFQKAVIGKKGAHWESIPDNRILDKRVLTVYLYNLIKLFLQKKLS